MKATRCYAKMRYQDVQHALAELKPLADRMGLTGKHLSPVKQKMTNLFLIYNEENKKEITRLIEEFSAKARELEIVLKISDFHDI